MRLQRRHENNDDSKVIFSFLTQIKSYNQLFNDFNDLAKIEKKLQTV